MRLTRLLLLAGLALVVPFAGFPAGEASAQFPPCDEEGCEDVGTEPPDPGGPGGDPPPTTPPPENYFDDIWSTTNTNDANGNPCFQVIEVGDGNQLWGDAYEDAEDAGGTPCPGGQPTETPQEEVTRRWRQEIEPPVPTADITPFEAIAGLPAYLEVEEPATWTSEPLASQVSDRVFEIKATADWWIDWGDDPGRRDGPYTGTQGLPYPGGPGEISHVYSDTAEYDITVEAIWSASYRILEGPGAQNIYIPIPRPLLTSYDIDGFPVGDVQAIRVR